MPAPTFASQVDRVSDDFHHSLGGGKNQRELLFTGLRKTSFLMKLCLLPLNYHPLIPPPTSASILNRHQEKGSQAEPESTVQGL